MDTQGFRRTHGSTALFGMLLVLMDRGAASAAPQVGAPLFPNSVTPGFSNVAIARDFNGDGKPDLATSYYDYSGDETTLTILLAQGNGTFTPNRGVLLGPHYVAVTSGEFNGDEKPDLVTTSYLSGGTVNILLGQGDGSFGAPASFGVAGPPVTATVADFNEDGNQDLAAANGTAGISILLGDGTGSFTGGGTFPVSLDAVHCVVGDFNGDAHEDLVASYNGWFKDPIVTLNVLLGDGSGGFTSKPSFSIGHSVATVVAGDFNADGHDDLAMTYNAGGVVTILLGQSDGSFLNGGNVPAGSLPSQAVVEDFNGDARPDLLVATSGSATVLLGHGDGTFTNAGEFDFGPFIYGGITGSGSGPVVVADFNADAKLDLATPTVAGMTLMLGQGNGTFTGKLTPTVGSSPLSVTVNDFDGDGNQDLATANSGDDDVSILLGHGDGSFAGKVSIPVGYYASWVATADFNRDGKPDLAAATYLNGVVTLLGAGDGTFTNSGSTLTAGAPTSISAAEFNSDGVPDLAVVQYQAGGSSSVAILLGQGNGAFADNGSIATGLGTREAAAGDFDGDGKQDLATADYASTAVGIFLGAGDGTFTRNGSLAVGGKPVSVALADFNNDGMQDLVSAIAEPNGVTISLGHGDGDFTTSSTFAVGQPVSSVQAVDFDDDGHVDIVANAGYASVSLLLGQGDGSLASNGAYAVGLNPLSLAAADFNGDAHPDVATADAGLNTLSILLNQMSIVTSVWSSLGSGLPGTKGIPLLTGTGVQTAGSPVSLNLTKAADSARAMLFIGPVGSGAPFKGGTLIPSLMLSVALTTSPAGAIKIPFAWPAGLPASFSVSYQYGVKDAAALQGVALSNALQSTAP